MTNQLKLSNEVQFWNLMLHGHIDDAQKLLPHINFKPDNYEKSLNPAQLALNEVFQTVGEERFRELIISVLKHISKINLNRSDRSSQHENLAIDCCVAALNFMLDKRNRTLDCITPTTRGTAEKLLAQLKPYSNRSEQTQQLPKCVKTLMSLLNNKTPEKEETLLTPSRTLLPSGKLHTSYCGYDTGGSSQREKESFEYFRPRSPIRSH